MPITITLKAPPPPPKKSTSYPFAQLIPGGMFFVPLYDSDAEDIKTLAKRVSSAASMRRQRHPHEEYQTSEWEEDGQIGVGVWRLA